MFGFGIQEMEKLDGLKIQTSNYIYYYLYLTTYIKLQYNT